MVSVSRDRSTTPFLHSPRVPAHPSPISVGPVVRDPDEEHRASTPLELFFDLCFVVAVAQASSALHHELVEGHVADGVIGFLMAFFGVWWAWMNFTWFASAHDANDVPYRLLTLLQIVGVLIYAAGVTEAVEEHTFTVAVIGYLVMRAGLITQWLRVARRFPELRQRSLRYAGGIAVVQLLWLFILVTPPSLTAPLFALLAIGELAVPVWAERANRGDANYRLFHAAHIEERYGLFTIIVLGESILSASIGIRQVATDGITAGLIAVAAGGRAAGVRGVVAVLRPPGSPPTFGAAVHPLGLHARHRVRLTRRARRRLVRRRRSDQWRRRQPGRGVGRGHPGGRLPGRTGAADGVDAPRRQRRVDRLEARRRDGDPHPRAPRPCRRRRAGERSWLSPSSA